MAKNWIKITTVNDTPVVAETAQEKFRRQRSFQNAAQNMKSLTSEEIKKHSEELFVKKQSEDVRLLDAFEQKKLKSKAAIDRAIQLKKIKDAEAAKKQKKVAEPAPAVE